MYYQIYVDSFHRLKYIYNILNHIFYCKSTNACKHVSVHMYLLCRGHAGTHRSCLTLRELHVEVQSKHNTYKKIQTLLLD